MPKRNLQNTDGFQDAIEIATMLKPLIERSVRKLSDEHRAILRLSILNAQKHLADVKLPAQDRILRVQKEFEAHAQCGSVWQLIVAKVGDYTQSGTRVGHQELGSVALILGLLLDAATGSPKPNKKKSA